MNNRGLLLNLAIGDAFGRPFEFTDKDEIEQNFDIKKYAHFGAESIKTGIGKYTDDTQMSMAIADHMLHSEEMSHHSYAVYFYNSYDKDPRSGYSRRIRSCLVQDSVQGFISKAAQMKPRNSNGSVMRCLPLGMYPDVEDVKKACLIQTTLTHPTFECITATLMVALSFHYYYYRIEENYYNWISYHISHEALGHILSAQLNKKVECDAIQTASFCLKLIQDAIVKEYKLSKILEMAIKVTGDVDSTAAICLGLSSAIDSIENDLDDNLFNKLENREYGRDYLMNMDKLLINKFPRK